jgi:superfamily II DNA/RNA helicase
MTFSSLGLSPQLCAAIQSIGFDTPTDIQCQAIPAVLEKRDLIARAQTGSGKTLAFALPVIDQWMTRETTRPRLPTVLVLVPTRELATQVADSFTLFAGQIPQPPKVSTLFGGVSINPQMMALRGGTDIVIATPGRLIDLLERNALRLFAVQTLVLDEADRLMDLGFAEEIQHILNTLPPRRQSLFFSATFPDPVRALARRITNSAAEVESHLETESPADIKQLAIEVDAPQRTQLLRHLIQTHAWDRVLVFVATKHAAEIVADKLRKARINAEPFHGVLSQGKRTQVLADFKAARIAVVVATDIAARGIDVAQLSAVVNYDLPRSAVDYTHRIGRTGRAGASGTAISFVNASTAAHFELIQKRNRIKVALEHIAGFEPQYQTAPLQATRALAVADPNGGIKGKRPNKKDKARAAAAIFAATANQST